MCDVKIKEQIDYAAAYKDNPLAFLAGKGAAVAIGMVGVGAIGAGAYLGAIKGAENYSENKHKTQKKEGQELFSDYMNACKDLIPAKEIIKELDMYNSINNDPIELICTEDGGYVKICFEN